MVVPSLEMGGLVGWMRRFEGGQRLCLGWNVRGGVWVERWKCGGIGEIIATGGAFHGAVVYSLFTGVLLCLGVLYCLWCM